MQIKQGWEGIVLGVLMLVVALSLILGFRYVTG
jgi:hypothetical protein